MKPNRWVGRFLRRAVRVGSAGLTAVILLLVALAITAAPYVRHAVTRIDIDAKALSDVMRDAVIVAIREGGPEQKLEMIAALESIGPADAGPFVPALTDATKDNDPQVRHAAKTALDRIAPDALKDDEEE